MTPAIIDILVGLWIFMSSFAWGHTVPEFVNTLVTGSLAVLFGIATLADRRARYFEIALGVWLLLSMRFLTADQATHWNNGICGAVLLLAGLLGWKRRRAPDPQARP
jgi:uncharacterized membrane protein